MTRTLWIVVLAASLSGCVSKREYMRDMERIDYKFTFVDRSAFEDLKMLNNKLREIQDRVDKLEARPCITEWPRKPSPIRGHPAPYIFEVSTGDFKQFYDNLQELPATTTENRPPWWE